MFRILQSVAVMSLVMGIGLAASMSGCKKEEGKNDKAPEKKEEPTIDEILNDGEPDHPKPAAPPEDDLLKDDYRGVYEVKSQVETPYGSCDETTAEPATWGLLTFFNLDTVFEITMDPTSEPKTDLWLSECTDAATCQGQVGGFVFHDKADGIWGGWSAIGVGKSDVSPEKCSFSYTENVAKLVGKDIVVTTSFNVGEVDKLAGGCTREEGLEDFEPYYAAYRGKIVCKSLDIIKAQKLDVPLPK